MKQEEFNKRDKMFGRQLSKEEADELKRKLFPENFSEEEKTEEVKKPESGFTNKFKGI